jgi:hypothetical protein
VAQKNAINLKSSPVDVALWTPGFRFEEIWPECLKELVAIYRESGMIRDEKIATEVMMIEQNLRYGEMVKKGQEPR